jgi:hypothetical protein
VVFAYPDSFWERQGQNGDIFFETAVLGGTWVQHSGIISALVPPERLAAFLTTSPRVLQDELIEEMAGALGPKARSPQQVYFRAGPPTRGRRGTSPAGVPAT